MFDLQRFKPQLDHRGEVWNGFLLDLTAGFWFTGILWGCGRFLRKWLALFLPNAALSFCLEIGLGIFFVNTLWMGLGLTRLWFRSIGVIALFVFTILLAKNLLQIQWKNIRVNLPKWHLVFWLGIGGIYFGFLLLHCLLPETFYDSLNYFLGMPHFWFFQHGITDYPTHLLSGYFHGGSLFYAVPLVLAGTEGAKVLSAFVLFLCALFAYGWVREITGSGGGVVAATAVLTFPLIYLNAWATRVDGLLSFSLLFFFFCLQKACFPKLEKGRKNWFFASALFAGLALSIKPTAFVGILAAFGAILWQSGFSIFKRKDFWLGFVGLGLLEVGPWLLKNIVFTGNVFFPYAISWIGGRQFPASGYERLLGENRQFLPMDHGLWSFLDLPWRLTMPQAGDGQFIGPLFLAFLPALLFLKTPHLSVKFFTKIMVLSFVLGLSLSHMLRFSMPAFLVALLLFSALFFTEKKGPWKVLWMTAVLGSALLCFGNYLDLSAQNFDGAGVWAGLETRAEYLNRKLPNPYEPLALWTGENLLLESRLLLVGDARGVYYEHPTFAQSVFDEPFFAQAARREKDAAGIAKRLKQLGITHVVVNTAEGLRVSKEYHQYELSPQEWKKLNDFVRFGLKPVYWKNFQGVYEVQPQLSAPSGPALVNPFSFFAPEAYDFIQDFQGKNYARAEKDLDNLLKLFPRETYWREKKVLLEKTEKESLRSSKE